MTDRHQLRASRRVVRSRRHKRSVVSQQPRKVSETAHLGSSNVGLHRQRLAA